MSTPSPLSGNPLLAIFELSAALVSSTSYQDVMAEVAAKIGEAMNVSSCNIHAYVPERDVFIYEARWRADGVADDQELVGRVFPARDRPDLKLVFDSPGIVERHIDDPMQTPEQREELARWGFKSLIATPLRVGDRPIGLLGAQESRFPRRFTKSEKDLFGWLCELAALGIHNAGLMRRDQDRARHLASLEEISRALAGTRDPSQVFSAIAVSAANALGAPRATVYEYDGEADTLTPVAIHQPEGEPSYYEIGVPRTVEEAFVDRAMLTDREPVVESVSDPGISDAVREDLLACGEKTALTVPISYLGEAMGLLMVLWTQDERLVTDDELVLAKGIGGQAAMALLMTRGETVSSGAPAEAADDAAAEAVAAGEPADEAADDAAAGVPADEAAADIPADTPAADVPADAPADDTAPVASSEPEQSRFDSDEWE